MAHSFTNPVNSTYLPPILPESKGPEFNLFRHYRSRSCSAVVAILSDGTVVQDITTDTPVAINGGSLPYPWNPNDPSGPYVSYTDALGVQQYIDHPSPWIVTLFYGTGPHPVSDADFATLSSAGYGACLS